MTIREDLEDDTNYCGIMFCQVTVKTATNKDAKLEYKHMLSQSGGHINPTRVLLDDQSNVYVFSNRLLLKNIQISDRALKIFSMGGQITTDFQGDLLGYGTA